MTWQLRRAVVADLSRILEIERSVFATDAWSESMLRDELESTNTSYVVATPIGAPEIVQGYAGLMLLPGATEADVQTIAVAPEARRMGLGRVLMHTLIRKAREAGVRDVFLEVRADNAAAQALYDSLGFVGIGVRPGYYQPDDVDAIVMKLVLARPSTPIGAP
ncbi:ribosomal-protein-alanine N-acetyltransferase [Mycetocola manganoxydans]|uniref:Ribosomal-protein-alanine N-acetyltransferase n=1 Tax=Mycetocola manganoxydans TaxID=699879 RepID=A0A3L6ZY17_9MICO|nr:ribosomal protein S18-alanine N-acetyltransferase [Mycetocola manganoxydans]RLP72022.1 ribosomal-protein-alanine N-acetyltransferase [Mycetocola manganoxydans]GHD47585.1 ribosomal-protein-alanine acetyltransferase [Mycetocola manganoxydans]